MRFFDRLAGFTPTMLGVLRIITALTFLEHGTMKILHFPAMVPPMPHGGLPPPIVIAGLLELVGGSLLAVGLFTRGVAFTLSGEMAAAYFIAHFPQSPLPVLNHGEPAVLYCFIFLFLACAGPGRWSVDALRHGEERLLARLAG